MSRYLIVWFIILGALGFEYTVLNFAPDKSLLLILQKKGYLNEALELTPAPGRPLSLWLGWAGLGLMVIMNLYSMRKRIGFMQNWGRLSSWLNFHVFCGLLGPTFILFHCNFKVRGLVGISFWSMVISFSSGIIGRYFYVQMLREKKQFEDEAESIEARLKKLLQQKEVPVAEEVFAEYKNQALVFVGMPQGLQTELNPWATLVNSIVGDMRLSFGNFRSRSLSGSVSGWASLYDIILLQYAVQKRRAHFLGGFQKLMGYWHTFHFPFAIFMYIVAVIHVAAALVLGV